jgi:hypothetical protein
VSSEKYLELLGPNRALDAGLFAQQREKSIGRQNRLQGSISLEDRLLEVVVLYLASSTQDTTYRNKGNQRYAVNLSWHGYKIIHILSLGQGEESA